MPILPRRSWSRSSRLIPERSSRRVAWMPWRDSSSTIVGSCLTASLRSCQRTSFHVATGSSATATIVSPFGEARHRGRRLRGGGSREHRLVARHAGHEEHPVEDEGEQEIRRRAGEDDEDAGRDALVVEGARSLALRDRALALVEHLHVAAQRDRGHHPLGAVGPAPADQQRTAEAHVEAQDLHVHRARGQVVAELVDHHEHAHGDEEGDDVQPEVAHARLSRDRVRGARAPAQRIGAASARASMSAA